MSQSCLDCAQRPDGIFCDLPPDALHEFDRIKSGQSYPRGTILFGEGQQARSVFLLCEGRVRLWVCSENGRRLVLHVASPGEVLGLSAVLSGRFYEVTAEALDRVQAAEIQRKDLLHFLHEHCDVCMQVVHLISEDLHEAYKRIRSVGLVRTRHNHNHNHTA
ncbi:MAG: cyclic nucleotide-binding domain-containing protein [Terriglobales bacterium]|jgi:CRP/FNR family transcriptional regulator